MVHGAPSKSPRGETWGRMGGKSLRVQKFKVFFIPHSSFVIRHSSLFTFHSSFLIRHSSLVTRHSHFLPIFHLYGKKMPKTFALIQKLFLPLSPTLDVLSSFCTVNVFTKLKCQDSPRRADRDETCNGRALRSGCYRVQLFSVRRLICQPVNLLICFN